jgi:mono/diheme cytochrome c family protein
MVQAMFATRIKKVMPAALLVVLLGVGIGFIIHGQIAAEQPKAKAPNADQAALIKRGEYLVNEVARCGDCHTPRNGRGKPDNTRLLQGGPMPFAPRVKAGEWEDHSPDITASGKAGKWTEAKMVKFLSTGGKSDPPMPAYHLTEDDARAVTAYLRSLPGKQGGDNKKEKRGERKDDKKREKKEQEDN